MPSRSTPTPTRTSRARTCPAAYSWLEMAGPWDDRTPSMRELMVDHGDGDEAIWITEFSAPTGGDLGVPVSEERQAEILGRATELAQSYPWLGGFLWYSVRDARAAASSSGCCAPTGRPSPPATSTRGPSRGPAASRPAREPGRRRAPQRRAAAGARGRGGVAVPPAVRAAVRSRIVPPAPVRIAQRLAMKRGRLGYLDQSLEPMARARRTALGTAGAGPPRLWCGSTSSPAPAASTPRGPSRR